MTVQANQISEFTKLADDECNGSVTFDETEEAKAMIVDFAVARKRQRQCKRVSFADKFVTEVRDRPRTERGDIPILFYSAVDIKEFRQAYRDLIRRRIAAQRPQQGIAISSNSVSGTVATFVKSATQLVRSIAGEAGLLSQEVSEPNIFVDTLYLF